MVDGRGRRLVCEVVGASKTGLDLVVASAADEAGPAVRTVLVQACPLYPSDAADEKAPGARWGGRELHNKNHQTTEEWCAALQ